MRCAHDYCRASREADGETRCRFLSWRENSMLLSSTAGAGADQRLLHRASFPFQPGEHPTGRHRPAPRISSPAPATFFTPPTDRDQPTFRSTYRLKSEAPREVGGDFDPLQGRTPEQQQRNEDTAVVVFGLLVSLVTITAIYLWAVA